MENRDVEELDKRRLRALYMITRGRVYEDDWDESLRGLSALGVTAGLDTTSDIRAKRATYATMLSRSRELLKESDSKGILLSRFESSLGQILESMEGGSDTDRNVVAAFPFVGDAKQASKANGGKGHRRSTSNSLWSRNTKSHMRNHSSYNLHGALSGGPRLIVFIVGGVAWSEIRLARLFSEKYGRDVFIGSTSTVSATQFLDSLLPVAPKSELDVVRDEAVNPLEVEDGVPDEKLRRTKSIFGKLLPDSNPGDKDKKPPKKKKSVLNKMKKMFKF